MQIFIQPWAFEEYTPFIFVLLLLTVPYVGYIMEAVEDALNVSFLPLDLVLFGHSVAANKDGIGLIL